MEKLLKGVFKGIQWFSQDTEVETAVKKSKNAVEFMGLFSVVVLQKVVSLLLKVR